MDEIVSVLPVHYSNKLGTDLQLHQYPLQTRPLQAPPSAVASGKRISARVKPNVRRIEIQVPADSRSDVWNPKRAKDLGAAQLEDDRERNQEQKSREGQEPRLSEVRLKSEEIPQHGVYMLGVLHDGMFFHISSITPELIVFRSSTSSPDKRIAPISALADVPVHAI